MRTQPFIFIRAFKREMGIDIPFIALWSCGIYKLQDAQSQYPDNVVVVYATEYRSAKDLARQYFEHH